MGCRVPFVISGTIFVAFILILGIITAVSYPIGEALNSATQISADLLDGSSSVLGILNTSMSSAAFGVADTLNETAVRLVLSGMDQAVVDIKRDLFEDPLSTHDILTSEYSQVGKNFSTITQAIEAMKLLHSPLTLDRMYAQQIEAGADLRYLSNMMEVNGGDGAARSGYPWGSYFFRPFRVAFLYNPYVARNLGWPTDIALVSIRFVKRFLPEMMTIMGNGDLAAGTAIVNSLARDHTAWGLAKGGWRVIDSADPSWSLGVAIVDNGITNATHRRLFNIDDPNINMLSAGGVWNVTLRQFDFTKWCYSGLSLGGGVCWGSAYQEVSPLADAQLFSAEQVRAPGFKMPRVTMLGDPFAAYGSTFFTMKIHHFPNTGVDQKLNFPTHPQNLLNVHAEGADLGRSGIAFSVHNFLVNLVKNVQKLPYSSAFGMMYSELGTTFVNSLYNVPTFGKKVFKLQSVVASESNHIPLSWALFVNRTMSAGYSSLAQRAGVQTHCIPGALIAAALPFFEQHKKIVTLGDFVDVLNYKDDPIFYDSTGRHFADLPCGEAAYPNHHEEDRIVYTQRLIYGGREYGNETNELKFLIDDPFVTASAMFSLALKFSDVLLIVPESKAVVVEASTNASASVMDFSLVSHRQQQTMQRNLMFSVILGIVVVTTFYVLLAALVFYTSLRPLQYVLIALFHVENFDLVEAAITLDEMQTVFTEFQKTREGVRAMVSRLAEYRRYLPEWLLAKEECNEKDEEASVDVRDSKAAKQRKMSVVLSVREKVHSRSQSARSRNSEGSIASSRQHVPGPAGAAATGAHFDVKNVALLLVQIAFHESDKMRTARVNALLTTFEPIVRRFRGSMTPEIVASYPDGISLLIIFNAQMPCRHMVSSALDCALAINSSSTSGAMKDLHVRCGVTLAKSVCGSVGTDTQRWYVTIGDAGTKARSLLTVATDLGCAVVIDSDAFGQTASEEASFNYLAYVTLDMGGTEVQSFTPFLVAQRLEQEDDEWMYMLQAASSGAENEQSVERQVAQLSALLNHSMKEPVPRDQLDKRLAAVKDLANSEDSALASLVQLYLKTVTGMLDSSSGSFSMKAGLISTVRFEAAHA